MFFRKQKQIDELKRQLAINQTELFNVKRQLCDTKLLLALETGSYPKNIKVDRLKTEILRADGRFKRGENPEVIKFTLAHNLANEIVKYMDFNHSKFNNFYDGKFDARATIEIVKRG